MRDVHEVIAARKPAQYTTILKLMQIMAEKGLVKQRQVQRALFYKPVYTREQVTSRFVARVFDGALDKLVLNMLQAEKVTPEEMRELERLIARARREKQAED